MWVGTFSEITPSNYSEGSHLGGRWHCLGILLPGCSSASDIYSSVYQARLQVNFLCTARSVLLHSSSHRLSRRSFTPVTVLLSTLGRRVSKWAAVGLLWGSCKFSDALVQLLIGALWARALLPPTPPALRGTQRFSSVLFPVFRCCLQCYQTLSSLAESQFSSICALFPQQVLIHQRHSCHALFDACFPDWAGWVRSDPNSEWSSLIWKTLSL